MQMYKENIITRGYLPIIAWFHYIWVEKSYLCHLNEKIYGYLRVFMWIYGDLYQRRSTHKSQPGFIKKINTIDSNPHNP